MTFPKTHTRLVAELGLNSGLSTASVLSSVTMGKYQTSLIYSGFLYTGIFANALQAYENLIQKIEIFPIYLVDGLLFALFNRSKRLSLLFWLLFIRSTRLTPNATLKVPPVLNLMRVPAKACCWVCLNV